MLNLQNYIQSWSNTFFQSSDLFFPVKLLTFHAGTNVPLSSAQLPTSFQQPLFQRYLNRYYSTLLIGCYYLVSNYSLKFEIKVMNIYCVHSKFSKPKKLKKFWICRKILWSLFYRVATKFLSLLRNFDSITPNQ